MSRPTVVRPDAAWPPQDADLAEDPFADLLEALEADEAPAPASPDLQELNDLFAAHAERPEADLPTAPRGSHWPGHNFGPAYSSLRRDRPHNLRAPVLGESDMWDVDTLTEGPSLPPQPAEEVPVIPWRTPPEASAAPDHWLEDLGADVAARPTEARLIELVQRGPRPARTVLDATEVLQARPMRTHGRQVTALRSGRLIPRTVEVAVLAVLLLFALAILQLLLS